MRLFVLREHWRGRRDQIEKAKGSADLPNLGNEEGKRWSKDNSMRNLLKSLITKPHIFFREPESIAENADRTSDSNRYYYSPSAPLDWCYRAIIMPCLWGRSWLMGKQSSEFACTPGFSKGRAGESFLPQEIFKDPPSKHIKITGLKPMNSLLRNAYNPTVDGVPCRKNNWAGAEPLSKQPQPSHQVLHGPRP